MRLVVAVTGATGAIYAVKLLEALKINEVDVHLIVSHWAEKTLQLETYRQCLIAIMMRMIYQRLYPAALFSMMGW